MKLQNIFRFVLVTILLSLLIHSTLFSQQAEYAIRRIDEPSAGGRVRGGLNDSSEVVGGGDHGAFHWKKGVVTILPIEQDPDYMYSAAYSINNNSIIAGEVFYGSTAKWQRAYRWENGNYLDLGGGMNSGIGIALAINSDGLITGHLFRGEPTYEQGVFTYDGSVHFLNINGTGWSINDSGFIVGNCNVSDTMQAFIYRNGILTLPAGMRMAYDINNRNQVVGGGSETLIWENGNLNILAGSPWSPNSINDNGIIVGMKSFPGLPYSVAVMWKNGVMSRLDSLVPQNTGVYLYCGVNINNKDEILCTGKDTISGVWYYYLLTPGTASLVKPLQGDVWISGERDTIKWDFVARGKNLLIEFSSDSGQTYNAIGLNVSVDSGKYVWDIPKDILSTKCFIRLRDNSTLDTLAVSEMFKIKPYIITRIDDNGSYVAYDKTIDRWGFGNYAADVWSPSFYGSFDYRGTDPFTGLQYPQDAPYIFLTAQPQDFTDWVSFVNAFGQNACYYSGTYYKPEALLRWGAMKGKWNGSCFAIAGSNALVFEKKDEFLNKFTGFPNFATPVSVTSNPGVIKTLTELYAQAYGNPTSSHENSNWLSKTPNQTLNDLKEMLKTDNTKIRTLSFWHNNGSGGHCILPYKVERSTIINSNWLVWVWDNSYPNDATAFVYVDTSGNNNNGIWYYSNWPDWGGPGKLILELESSTYLGTATLPKGRIQYSPFNLSDTILQVTTTYNADITISDNQGNITGYADSVLSYGITGSVPMILPTGSETPPYGYHLNTNDYSVVLDNFRADTIDTYFFTGNKIFSYGRYGATGAQTDRLFFDGGIAVTNPDAEVKLINLLSLSNDTINQKLTLVRSLELAENDSIKLDKLNGSKYRLMSFGTAKSYLLEIQQVSDSGLVRFRKSGISLGTNTAHTIEPNWDDLQVSLLTVLVDAGNDGTIDDTLRLQNELADIHDHGSLIPDEYKLYECYPNPFNPTTTISYQLSKQSHVTLKVFDVLGSEVATLVDRVEQPGYKTVKFDASELPSGLYFYRLQAGNYIETKKLVLLR